MIRRPRVLAQQGANHRNIPVRYCAQLFPVHLHLQAHAVWSRREARNRLRVAVGRHIGFDIVDGRPVHHVNARNMQDRTCFRIVFNGFQLHRRYADGIWPIRRTRREDPDANIAAKPRRTHRR